NFYYSRVPDRQSVAFFRARGRILEIDGTHHGGQHFRSAVYLPGTARHGGRSGTALSRIAGRIGDSQGRTARGPGRQISFLEYRRRRLRVSAGTFRAL